MVASRPFDGAQWLPARVYRGTCPGRTPDFRLHRSFVCADVMPPAGMHGRLLHPVAVRPSPLRGFVKHLVVPSAGVVDFGAFLIQRLRCRRRLGEGRA